MILGQLVHYIYIYIYIRLEGNYNCLRSTIVICLKDNLAECKVVTLPNIFHVLNISI